MVRGFEKEEEEDKTSARVMEMDKKVEELGT